MVANIPPAFVLRSDQIVFHDDVPATPPGTHEFCYDDHNFDHINYDDDYSENPYSTMNIHDIVRDHLYSLNYSLTGRFADRDGESQLPPLKLPNMNGVVDLIYERCRESVEERLLCRRYEAAHPSLFRWDVIDASEVDEESMFINQKQFQSNESAGETEAEAGSMFHPWGGGIRQLCERGFTNCSADGKKQLRAAPLFEPLPESEAKLELVRRYFEYYGPATLRDAAYFFGTSQTEVKKLLPKLPVSVREIDRRMYFSLGAEEPDCDMPGCVFLAGFDQLMLGYEKRESLFLDPEHLRGIFNLSGVVHPALLIDGKVAGRWGRKGRRLRLEFFGPASGAAKAAAAEAAERLWDDISALEFV